MSGSPRYKPSRPPQPARARNGASRGRTVGLCLSRLTALTNPSAITRPGTRRHLPPRLRRGGGASPRGGVADILSGRGPHLPRVARYGRAAAHLLTGHPLRHCRPCSRPCARRLRAPGGWGLGPRPYKRRISAHAPAPVGATAKRRTASAPRRAHPRERRCRRRSPLLQSSTTVRCAARRAPPRRRRPCRAPSTRTAAPPPP